jgi:hypothetical protein
MPGIAQDYPVLFGDKKRPTLTNGRKIEPDGESWSRHLPMTSRSSKPRMRRVAQAVLALSAAPAGFTASDLARQVNSMSGQTESEYGLRRAAYDIKKTSGEGDGLQDQKIAAVRTSSGGTAIAHWPVVLREKIIRPLLAARTDRKTSPSNAHRSTLRRFRAGIRSLFADLGIAA